MWFMRLTRLTFSHLCTLWRDTYYFSLGPTSGIDQALPQSEWDAATRQPIERQSVWAPRTWIQQVAC